MHRVYGPLAADFEPSVSHHLTLDLDDGQALPVKVIALELLPGVVGVLVPDQHPATGRSVVVPLA